jgi:DNA-binding NarL/FixJ family response regulator
MTTPCILILQQDVLLQRALESLLLVSNPDLRVVTSEALDIKGLVAEISKFEPDAVLLSESMPMAGEESLVLLLTTYPKLRVIVASESSNWLHLYSKQDILLTRLTDLLKVIKSD